MGAPQAALSTPDSPLVLLLAVLCTAVVRRVAVVCFAFASGLANVSFTHISLPLLCFRKRLHCKKYTFLAFSLRVWKKSCTFVAVLQKRKYLSIKYTS